MNWQLKTFAELTLDQLYDLLQLRNEVFVVEQACPYGDIDGQDRDPQVRHLLGYDGDRLLAYLRLLPPDMAYPGRACIGRVVTHPDGRGNGLGRRLLAEGLRHCERCWPQSAIQIGAQAYLQDFYAGYGFVASSEVYLEDGIPHLHMLRPAG
ncbi:GNAT family N-acetyltransferase [Marinobacterium arenosum]|uniref:GNAT family N-acetyltransferase n=1 Tax=Marinobacterium arenosum TaxID=2862496 RepID=UPI001C978D36|nr:GNAT family N-acetyltransferase [Marinobacterium arenosum]MBY4677243.1 GNAT family N-acetyltransferase [Marinobacterium arenosum]